MLAWLSKSKNPFVSGMIVFGCGYWLDYGCIVLLCASLCSLVPCGNHAQLGVAVMLRDEHTGLWLGGTLQRHS